jgi:hypothetical protein
LGAAILASCTQGPTPTPTAASTGTSAAPVTSSTTSSTVATPTVSATSVPPSDDHEAVRAVQRYYDAFNAALRTLNTVDLRKSFEPGCVICEQDAATIDSTARAGQSQVGGSARVGNISVVHRGEFETLLSGTLTVDALNVRDAQGRIVEQYPAATIQKSFVVSKSSGSWLVRGIG